MLTPVRSLVKRASVPGHARDKIGVVTHWRLLVLAILVYVTLDLSLPGMPGAFVFEPVDSVEGTHIRVRAGAEAVALPAQARSSASALFQVPADVRERLAPVGPAERRGSPIAGWRFRVPGESPPSAEDSH